jgi:signal transduction histidine kinase
VKKANNTQYQPEITLQAKADGNAVKIIVRDNGIGIEDTITDKIFDPFFTTKTTGEAAGVGLYLSREIVQNHGGDISVQSVKNDYTEFTITLPYKKS